MAGSTKIVVARVYPKPGRLQEVIGVYAPIVGLVHQEPGCELFALHTDGETVFVVERWRRRQICAPTPQARRTRGPRRDQRSRGARRRRVGPRPSPVRRRSEGHHRLGAQRHHQPSRPRHGIGVFRWVSTRDLRDASSEPWSWPTRSRPVVPPHGIAGQPCNAAANKTAGQHSGHRR